MQKSNSEFFVMYYANLENAIRKKYGYDNEPVVKVSENQLEHYKEELTTLRIFRNVLSHSKSFGTKYCAEAHDCLLQTLKKIYEEVADDLLINNCVKYNYICMAKLSDNVLEFMNKMKKNIYTHIPILDDNKRVIGVFGESTLFEMFTKSTNADDLCLIDKNTTFNDIKEFILLENHTTEEFCFMRRHDTLLDARIKSKEIFNSAKRRLGMIFITENGKPNESLLGILTIWGIEGRETTKLK